MDEMSEAIDPSWWTDVFADTDLTDSYEGPEVLSRHLEKAAADPAVTGQRELVLRVLAAGSSASLNGEDWLEPFTPAMQWDGKRTALPSDLDPDQVALLARIAPLIERDDLRARVADIAWYYGDRSDVAMLERAIDSYRAAPTAEDSWYRGGRESWVRGLALAARSGARGVDRVREMSGALREEILAAQVKDKFRTVSLAETLRQHGRVESSDRDEVKDRLFTLAAESYTVNPRLSRNLEREGLAWLAGRDIPAANASTERIARSYIAEADARIESEPESGAMAEGIFLEKALAVLKTLPRSYRVATGIDELIASLRIRLRESRETSIEQMTRFKSDPIDLTKAVSYARAHVTGHADRFDALAAFATVSAPMDADYTRETAKTMLEGSISHIFGSSTFSSDFRKVAASPGSASDAGEEAVWAEMVRAVVFQTQAAGMGMIQPAHEVLTNEHRFSRQYLVSLCAESPTVPEGHELLWGTGLALGLDGNFGAAVSILVPQLEQAIRSLLHKNEVHTLFVDDDGVETEKGLNALLDMTETEEVFGAGLIMEMKAMLVVQGGPNLRNNVAHGLLNDASAWSYSSMYMWWFCLRLAVLPVISMMERARAHENGQPEKSTVANADSA